jgi:hypothetical protein
MFPGMILTWQMIVELFVLAIPVASVARTFVFEEVFRELRDYCTHRSQTCRGILARKFFYLFTCEYCFSHYVALFFMLLTGYHLLFFDWRGYLIAFFSLAFVANAYLNLYSQLRNDITAQKVETKVKEKEIEQIDKDVDNSGAKDGREGAREKTETGR